MAPRKMKLVALGPKQRIMKVRFQGKRRKAEILRQIKNDQECIREQQRKIEEMLMDIKKLCHQQKEETETIMKRTVRAQVKVVLMFKILKGRECGDLIKAARLTQFLRDFAANENAIVNLAETSISEEEEQRASRRRPSSSFSA